MAGKRGKREPDPDKALTQLQELFIHHLAQDPRQNYAKAAREAGYTCNNPDDYKKVGWALMNLPENAHVQAAYKKQAEARMAKWKHVSEEDILHMLQVQAFAPRHRIMHRDEHGELKVTPHEDLWPEEEWLIDSYRVIALNDGSGDTVAVPELVSRQNAIQMLAKARGMFNEKPRTGPGEDVQAARESLKSALAELAADPVPGQLDQPTELPGTPGA